MADCKLNWKDILNRAWWTAAQAATGVVTTYATAALATGNPIKIDWNVFILAGVSGVAAGVSLIKNVVVQKRDCGK